ncbi:MAG: ATP-binding cassette domain-containing protein [Treponema sp.]|jgi:ABC-type transporter Mla maintaining outer membrane lipid asymmetry ATPase subunit MlaF|nr:ATP-binding cassette domain-containing protein [Treponema sp.]
MIERMESLLELVHVGFSAQNQEVIRDVSWTYAEGKTTALVGPSGGGKSTVLKLSAGLLVPSRGEVNFRGKNISQMNRRENLEFRGEGAVVFQDSALWANQTIHQILELPLRVHAPELSPDARLGRVREVLRQVGYRKDIGIRPAMLSMGEQKLVAFARALMCRPRLLFLDEWTESLDDRSAQRLVGLVRERKALGHTIIFVSHDLHIIRDLADQALVISGGELCMVLTEAQIKYDDNLSRFLEKEIAS